MSTTGSENIASETSSPISSTRFCATDADVIFKSSDGVRFSIHRKNLETHSGGFPPAEFATQDEIVHLTEDAATLDLLFQFVYPQRLPDVNTMDFEVVAPLAEAAEKYEVFSAMYVCSTRLRNILPNHALAILAYAGKHGYPEIINTMAPLMFDSPLSELLAILPSHFFAAWTLYQEQWHAVRVRAANKALTSCGYHGHQSDDNVFKLYRRLADLKFLKNLEDTFALTFCCERMGEPLRTWKKEVEEDIKRIPQYIDFL